MIGSITSFLRNPIKVIFTTIAVYLSRWGLIDADRGRRTVELAWPRMLTGFARLSQRTADIVMIGIAVGPMGIAGIAFAAVYWEIGNSLSLGLSDGTISQVSQRFGADNHEAIDLAVKQSVWVGILIGAPFTIGYWLWSEPLIALFIDDAATITFGSTYLQILGLAMVPNFLNTIGSRALAGADDTWLSMSVRSTAAFANVGFNIVFIFGLGFGVAGAALGTLLSELLVTCYFAWGFLAGRAPVIGAFPVQLSLTRPHVDRELTVQLFDISVSLMGRRLSERAVRFPFLLIVGMFGPVVVAAYEICRQIRDLLNAPGWGFSMSASSLVGQALGRGAEMEAEAYADDIFRFTMAVYLASAALLLVFARPVTYLFVQDPETVSTTVPFVRVVAISLLGVGIDNVMAGALRATGDTNWLLYGKIAGLYLFMLPIAYLGVITPAGILALYAALVAETIIPGLVSWYRYHTGKWKAISRGYRPQPEDD